jgi:hypothetical protein
LLESRAPAVGVLLDKLRKSSVYHSIESKSRKLTESDILTLLDQEKIPWAWLRKEMLESIELNRVKKKGQVASAVKRHTKKCGKLQETMSKTTVQGTVELGTDKKKVEWQSSLYSLSIVFASELNAGLGRTEQYMDMAATVNKLLGTDMRPPADKKLSESWYYIASWLIFSMRKASKRRVGDIRKALELLVRTASITKEEAMENSSLLDET